MSNLCPQEVAGDSPLMEQVYKELRLTAWCGEPRMVKTLSYWKEKIVSAAKLNASELVQDDRAI